MSDHNSVAHAWANQTGRARKGFNMFYDGRTLYSYGSHFPIARITDVQLSDGRGVILFTSKGYSVSTAKHKSITRRAIDYSRFAVFEVELVNASTPEAHLANYEALIGRARESLQKAKRARVYASMHTDDALNAIGDANAYSAVFGLDMPHLTVVELDAASAAIVERANQQRAAAELAQAKAARERALRERETLREWLCGAAVYPPHTRVPYVRVHGDQVETTWGARVPLNDALRAWTLMKAARNERRALTVTPNGGLRVGDFTVSAINETGMRVGCHYIPFKFAQLAARCAGLEG